jgi:hypothetical protein
VRLATAAALAPLAFSVQPALAGTYTITQNTNRDISGWTFAHGDGFVGCSMASYPGVCNADDIAQPTALRIFAYGDANPQANGLWTWTAPLSTSIVSGSVSVYHNTETPNTVAYMKARLRSEFFTTSPEIHSAQGKDDEVWSIPSGNQVIGVGMRTTSAYSYTDKWRDNVRIPTLTATLRDDTPPTASISGSLADGTWHNETRPVSVTVNAHDDGAGVHTLELLDSDRSVLDAASAPASSAIQPGSVTISRTLSVAPADLGEGVHALTVRVTDAGGELVEIPLTLRVDSQPPAAFAAAPDHTTTDTRQAVSFRIDPGPSGLAAFDPWLDDAPMTVSGDTASFQPASDLSYGPHVVTWRALDGAGNLRDGQWRFDVLDAAPPAISDQTPAAGWTGEQRRPQIGFTLTDLGTGVDPSSLRVALDGVDVTAAGDFTNGRFTLTPQTRLSFDAHTLRVLASDRSGNAMPPATWSFTISDVTPPAVFDLRPDPSSSGSDRTPVVAFSVSDVDGSGIDSRSLAVTLDGVDVSADGELVNGRFTLTPAAPLAYSSHTVTARVSDLAGNTSDVRTWSFAVRDETPPTVSGREPAPGITVPGATAIAFDVADTGVGVDAASLHVLVDGADVMQWGTYSNGHFSYSPGNLGAGAHRVSVTVADKAGNTAGPVTWEFAVAKI